MIDYPFREFWSMVRRRFSTAPPVKGQPAVIDMTIDCEKTPMLWIAFVGDISPLHRKRVVYDRDILAFFSDCEMRIGNLEGVITDAGRRPYRHNHSLRVFEDLEPLGPLKSWVLSLANNHSADYGDTALLNTVEHLEAQGLRWVGTRSRPCVHLAPDVTLSAWTQWLNRHTTLVQRRDPAVRKTPGLHIAFPHWGFEHERHPRPDQELPTGYKLIVGHHSHLPQPFERKPDGTLVAWSLGNLLTHRRLPVLGEGALLKVGVHIDAQGPEIVRAHFRHIRLERSDPRYCRIVPS